MLERARAGCYPRSSLKDFPREWVTSCFAEVNDRYSVRSEYRMGIEWYHQDIRHEMPCGPFDVILCRHLVLTYFDEALQAKSLGEILSRLRPTGVLVTGKQEPLPRPVSELIEIRPRMGLYRKVDR
jgi:chemotaxis protein methyltransferase CheR